MLPPSPNLGPSGTEQCNCFSASNKRGIPPSRDTIKESNKNSAEDETVRSREGWVPVDLETENRVECIYFSLTFRFAVNRRNIPFYIVTIRFISHHINTMKEPSLSIHTNHTKIRGFYPVYMKEHSFLVIVHFRNWGRCGQVFKSVWKLENFYLVVTRTRMLDLIGLEPVWTGHHELALDWILMEWILNILGLDWIGAKVLDLSGTPTEFAI